MAANRKWDCSAVVYLSDGTVRAEDSFGEVIAEGSAGSADAAVLQAAIDSVHPAPALGAWLSTAGPQRHEPVRQLIHNGLGLRCVRVVAGDDHNVEAASSIAGGRGDHPADLNERLAELCG